MPILPNAQGFTISGGQFTDISPTITVNSITGIDVLLEASCPQAAHDSSARSYPPRCFPGTRQQYIEDIVNWVIPTLGNTPPPIYWMKGPAGVGKSAIAQTCSEQLKGMDKLGAAFFFSINGRDNPQTLFPSIAYQLSTIHTPYRELIDEKIRHDKTIVDKAMSYQFQYLIHKPLLELASQGKGIPGRTVIIVDGLDECGGAGSQSEIIQIVARAASDRTLPLCWAFFSRPEPHIEATFAGPSVHPHCHKVLLPISRDADGEIRMYLRNGFENILKRRNISMGSRWPSAEDMATIVSAAGGSFIYATTVLRFVDHLSPPGPQKRLRAIIDVILARRERGSPRSGSSTEGPFAELDAFYTLILQRIPAEIYPSVHLLLASICQGGALGVIFAANVLGLSKDEFETVCNHASAVVHLQNPGKDLELDPTLDTTCTFTQIDQDALRELDQKVTYDFGGVVGFYHKSFDDFLLDPARSGSNCVKASEALAKHYLKMHLHYDKTYCWRGSDLVLAPGVTDSGSSLSYPYTNELVNSLIKAEAYTEIGNEDVETFSQLGVFGGGGDRDFRKNLYVATYLQSGIGSHVLSGLSWGCECQYKSYPGIQIVRLSFAKFNVDEFKKMIKQREQANILQRYHPNLPSRIKSLFRDKSKKRFESAVYHMGQGEKSIFWYWEIDYELRHFRNFYASDWVEGERIFREEDFAAWPDWEYDL